MPSTTMRSWRSLSKKMADNAQSNGPLEAVAAEVRAAVEHLVTEDDTPKDIFSDKQQLRAYRIEGPDFRRLDGPIWFPHVGLGLALWRGKHEFVESTWLRWVDAAGLPLPTGCAVAETLRLRADAEGERTEAVSQTPQGTNLPLPGTK